MSVDLSRFLARPYVGIVGIDNAEDMKAVAKFAKKYAIYSGVRIQIGLQVNPKVIDMLDRGSNLRLPKNLREVREILKISTQEIPGVFNVVHYSDKEKHRLAERIDEIFGYTKIFEEGLCHGLQLNGFLKHLDYKTMKYLAEKYPGLETIVQIGANDIGDLSDRYMCSMIHRLLAVHDFVNYVLIDCSGGNGKPININQSAMIAKRIRFALPHIAIGFAGGLNEENVMFVVRRLASIFGDKNISIDAETGHRHRIGEEYGNDIFIPKKSEHFTRNSVLAFGY